MNNIFHTFITTVRILSNPLLKYRRILQLSLVFSPVVGIAAVANIPETGQQTSDFANDDGAIRAGVAWPSPRFTNNGDGTIMDELTGLMWLKDGNCHGNRVERIDAIGLVGFINANPEFSNCVDYVAAYSDWRLPNVNELESLINSGEPDQAAWLNGQGFTNIQSAIWYYWTSTRYASSGGNLAWGVRLSDGEAFFLPVSGTENGRHFAWAVRLGQKNYADASYPANVWKTGQTVSDGAGDDGGNQRGVSWPSPRFTDLGDETVIDNLTGLIWLKDTTCMRNQYPEFDQDLDAGDGGVTWPHALEFVDGINNGAYINCSAGYNDWRLPNRKELRSLIDYSQNGPAIAPDSLFTGSGGPSTYWTSTSSATVTDTAWTINMASGVITAGSKLGDIVQRSHFNAVFPVRGSGESVAHCSSPSIDLVQKAYIAYYGRPADPAGTNFWACQLDGQGGDLSGIIQSFGVSDEFNQIYGSLNHSELIDTIYQQMFGRDPDVGGKSFYLGVLDRGERSLQSITLDVLFGSQGDDSTIIENKLGAARYFTSRVVETGVNYDLSNLNQIKDIIAGVNHTKESLTNTKQSIDGFIGNN